MTVRRQAAAHVFVRDIAQPILEQEDHHHLTRALRLRPDEQVTVSDGRGTWRLCAMTARGDLQPVDDSVHSEARTARPITVAFGVTKSDKPETVVQKLTEIGVDHIVPVILDHSIVRWDENKLERQHERFAKVAREAAMQSRQVFLPTIHRVVTSLEALITSPLMVEQEGRVALAEPGGTGSLQGLSAVVVGPEGGFSARELALVEDRVELVGGILRAETAAIAAGVLLAHSRSTT